jgi:hypothetical protein
MKTFETLKRIPAHAKMLLTPNRPEVCPMTYTEKVVNATGFPIANRRRKIWDVTREFASPTQLDGIVTRQTGGGNTGLALVPPVRQSIPVLMRVYNPIPGPVAYSDDPAKKPVLWNALDGREISARKVSAALVPYQGIHKAKNLYCLWVPQGVDIYVGEEKEQEDATRYENIPPLSDADAYKVENIEPTSEQPPAVVVPQAPKPALDLDFWDEIIPIFNGFAPATVLYRSDNWKDRYYFRRPEVGPAVGYLSMTSFVKKALPTGQALINWYKNNGASADDIRDERAEYGTTLHIAAITAVITGGGSFEAVSEYFEEAAKNTPGADPKKWVYDGVRDLVAFLQFIRDRNVEILAAEYPVYSDRWGVAGCLDLVCRMDWNKSRVNAIIDLKSGRKGFWDSHECQLAGYRAVWNEMNGSFFEVPFIFNWRPSEWRETPKYELKNQSDSVFTETIEHRLALAKLEGWVDPPTTRQIISGTFEIGSFDWKNHVENRPLWG